MTESAEALKSGVTPAGVSAEHKGLQATEIKRMESAFQV
jgi:hypothetical protein